MTLTPAKVKGIAVERSTERSLTYVTYALPAVLLFALIVASVLLSARASFLEREIVSLRTLMGTIQQHEELLNVQISKLTVGKDLVTW